MRKARTSAGASAWIAPGTWIRSSREAIGSPAAAYGLLYPLPWLGLLTTTLPARPPRCSHPTFESRDRDAQRHGTRASWKQEHSPLLPRRSMAATMRDQPPPHRRLPPWDI